LFLNKSVCSEKVECIEALGFNGLRPNLEPAAPFNPRDL
jgi:hypothetical protein